MLNLASHHIRRNPKKTPHPYQEVAITDIELSWEVDGWKSPMLCMPTGSGKSYCTEEHCARTIESGGRALFLAPTKELVTQPRNAFEEDFGCQGTIEMGSLKADDSPMVFSSIQTMVNRVKQGKWRPDEFDLIVVDEAHGMAAPTWQHVLEHFGKNGTRFLPCTATPRRGDKKDLLQYCDGIGHDKPIQELFRDGFLICPTIVLCPLGIEIVSKTKEPTDEEIGHAIEPYLEAAANEVMKHARGRCGLSFLPLRSTARMFKDILSARGLRVEYIGGDVIEKEQKNIKKRLIMGKLDHVCNAQIWGVGVDIRPLNLLVDLRPTQSWTSAMQKWGRLTRTWDPAKSYAEEFKGTTWGRKEDALLLDFCFETNQHSMLVRPAAMIARDKQEEEAMTQALAKGGGGSLLQAQSQAVNDRNETLRKRLEAMRGKRSMVMSALDFFMSQNRMDMVDYEPTQRWELKPPTEEQIDTLHRRGIAVDADLNQGKAAKLLDMLTERFKRGLATAPQANFMLTLGHPDPWNVGFEEAKRWLDQKTGKRK